MYVSKPIMLGGFFCFLILVRAYLFTHIPDPFWILNELHISPHLMLLCFGSLVFLGVAVYLKIRVHELQHAKNNLQESIQQHKVSSKAYKKLKEALAHRKNSHIRYVVTELDVCEKFLRQSKMPLPEFDMPATLRNCSDTLDFMAFSEMAVNPFYKIEAVPIDLKSLLCNIHQLFAERIHQAGVQVELTHSDDLFCHGDPLQVELILLNFIGKSVYSVPRSGQVSIGYEQQKESLILTVQDSGYPLEGTAANLVKEACDFFVRDDVLKDWCRIQGISYRKTISEDLLNVTTIDIPILPMEALSSNVVRIFQ